MNQRKVEIKLMRHLIQSIYNNQDKTIKVDNFFNKTTNDLDIISLVEIIHNIKTVNFNFGTILWIYQKLAPSLIKRELNKEYIKKELLESVPLDEEQIFTQIIKKKLFYDLTFEMAIIIYNILYFRKFNTFLVFYYHFKPHIYEIMQRDEKETLFFSNIYISNKTYHIKKNTPRINDLSINLIKIFNDYKCVLNLKRIGLFGSYGLGDYNEYSDIDILVEVENKANIEKVHIILSNVLRIKISNYIDLIINYEQSTPEGFMKNCYKNVRWLN